MNSQTLTARNMWMSIDPAAHLTDDEKQAYKQVFDEFDRDGGGSIDVTELREAFWALGGEPSLQEVAAIMKEIDTDGNGTLDFNEFLKITHPKVVDNFKDLEETFNEWDKDQDGYLSSVELYEYLNSLNPKKETKSSPNSRKGSLGKLSRLTGDVKTTPPQSRGNSILIRSSKSPLSDPDKSPSRAYSIHSRRSSAFVDLDDTMTFISEILDNCEDSRGLSFEGFIQMLTT